MSEKNACRLPAGEPDSDERARGSLWTWVLIGLGVLAVAGAYFGTRGGLGLPEVVTGGLGVVGLLLLFGGLGATGGSGGGG